MKKFFRNIAILFAPVLFMILVNETANQPTKSSIENCSWECHQNTNYCKTNHVKFLKSYFKQTDSFYFGIINSFHQTGKYRLMNVLVLGFLIPMLIYWLLIKVIDLEIKIRKLK